MSECTCEWSSEARGDGYWEHVCDPNPDCPMHGAEMLARPATPETDAYASGADPYTIGAPF